MVYSPPSSHHDESCERDGQQFCEEEQTMLMEKARHAVKANITHIFGRASRFLIVLLAAAMSLTAPVTAAA